MTRLAPRALLAALLAALTTLGALGAATAGPATPSELPAAVSSDDRPAFYQPPAVIPGQPGVVLRSEPMDFFLDPARTLRAPARATRVMYASTDAAGEPMAVTGSVLVPSSRWQGSGSRPLVAFAVGTQGLSPLRAPIWTKVRWPRPSAPCA